MAEPGDLVSAKEPLSSISQPVPELPVADVERAQQHYRDVLGFEIGWLYPDKEIGAVSRGDVVIFFRRRKLPFEPAVHWVFAEDLDASYRELKSSGASIVEPLERETMGTEAVHCRGCGRRTSSTSTMIEKQRGRGCPVSAA